MKKYLSTALTLLSLSPFKNASADTAALPHTLGVLDGSYDGGGSLQPESALIPQMSFTSHRAIHDGIVEAQSKAYLLGFNIATVNARLKFVPLASDPTQYDVLDLDQDQKKVGSAACDSASCRFKATVTNGDFTLRETWTPSEHGFVLSEGFQILKGKKAHYSGGFDIDGSSYNEIHDMVFSDPLKALPTWNGIDPKQVFDAFFLRSGEIVDRSHATFDSQSDFRPARAKLLHPVGVCAEVDWKITEVSQATGLFSAGTHVPGIIRFSTGTSDSAYLEKGPQRIFGFAAKLFPTDNLDQKVETVNIQTLDRYGFDRSPRKRYFYEDQTTDGKSEPAYFTNVAPAKSAFGRALATFFDRFDKPNFTRPVYPLAEVDGKGQTIQNDVAPYEIRFIPAFKPHPEPLASQSLDFRDEIQAYSPGEIVMDIVIQSYEPRPGQKELIPVVEKIGQMTIGKSVVSNTCDLNLHFHHPLNRFRQDFTKP